MLWFSKCRFYVPRTDATKVFKTLSFETPPALYPKPLNPNAFFCPADAVPIGATSWRRVRLWVVEVCLASADLPKVLGP